ncbi:acetyl-CoA carboxylase biotin carboxylase subunit family protein [Streptomyces sp. NPDC050560]|uniref:acetyl-CoA carboxylase biotin carboxylase subunit family protein n=1 Tax=Streptomyces sp. NPDC050560 TaxID=3365630 RepID=UPI00378DC533
MTQAPARGSTAGTLLVAYDAADSTLSPLRVAEAAADLGCAPAFITAGTYRHDKVRPLLASLGRVVDGSGGPDAALVGELRGLRPAGVVTFNEMLLPFVSRLAYALDLPAHAPADLGPITRKPLQRQRLADRGVEVVRFREVARVDEVESALAHVGLPAMVKPTVGAGSRGTLRVHTRAQCAAAVAEIVGPDAAARGVPGGTAIVEEFLAGAQVEHPWGDYIGVSCIVGGDDVHPFFIAGRFASADPFRERGAYGRPFRLPEPVLRAARELACRVVRALDVRNGVCEVELKLTSTGLRVLELNGRLAGWVDEMAVRTGSADPADLALRSALGLEIPVPSGRTNGLVAFVYNVVPPMTATGVVAVGDGLLGLRALDTVERVEIHTAPGAPVDWREGTRSRVASVSGTVADAAELPRLVARIENTDWIEYR